MSEAHVERVQRVFTDAIELPASERRSFVERETHGDPATRQEVLSLLGHHDDSGAFLAQPALAGDPDLALALAGEAPSDARVVPERISSYAIERVIGEGGMGVVYLARQENPSRPVALKVIRPGFATERLLLRFEREAQMLGRLHHPGIAPIFEAGTAELAGVRVPFLAMELVRGVAITEHVARERLDLRARLELVALVCDAVEHAHRQGVLHRDLKPANILIDVSSGRAQPKVLDFGIARAADATDAALLTDTGQIVGTVAYMSPEQASGTPQTIDARADVYALGVVAYEILTGRLPLDVAGLPLLRAVAVVREEEPAPPSRFDPKLAGDVDTILSKALEKDLARRYTSAAELAADLRRTLGDEPIRARPPSRIYRLTKFTRRHRALVAGAAAVFVVLCAGIATTTVQAVKAARARDDADDARGREVGQRLAAVQAKNRAEGVSEYFQQMLISVIPGQAGPGVTLADVLDRAAHGLPGSLAATPDVEADVRDTLGLAYQRLGRLPESEAQLRASLELRRKHGGGETAETWRTTARLGRTLLDLDRIEEAESLLQEAYPRLVDALGASEAPTLEAAAGLGLLRIRQSRLTEAEEFLRGALLHARANGDDRDAAIAMARSNLGVALTKLGKLSEAEDELRAALALGLSTAGELDPQTARTYNNLATTLDVRGDLAGAEEMFRKASDLSTRINGERHPDTLAALNNLAVVLQKRKAWIEAVALRRRVQDLLERTLGPTHVNTLTGRGNLALLLAESGELDAAEAEQRALVATMRELFGARLMTTLGAIHNLAWILSKNGHSDEALPLYEEVVTTADDILEPTQWERPFFRLGLGQCQSRVERYDEAERSLLAANRELEEILGHDHLHTRTSREVLAAFYERWGRPESAARWK